LEARAKKQREGGKKKPWSHDENTRKGGKKTLVEEGCKEEEKKSLEA